MKKCPYCGRDYEAFEFESGPLAGICYGCRALVQRLAEDLARSQPVTYEQAIPCVRAGMAHMRVVAEQCSTK